METLEIEARTKLEPAVNGEAIQGIRAGFPSAMPREQAQADEIMLISHPGWSRYCFRKDNLSVFDFFKRKYKEITIPALEKQQSFDEHFSDIQLFKDLLSVSEGFEYILEELRIEMAVQFAKEKGIPVILTIPCNSGMRNSEVKYTVHNNFHFTDYINNLIGDSNKFYVLPTRSNKGIIQWDFSETIQQAADFHRTGMGREIFGELLDKTDREVFVAGGQLGACLENTVLYFGSQSKINFLDTAIYTGYDIPKLSEEDLGVAKGLIAKLHIRQREPESREALLKVLEKYDMPVEERNTLYQRMANALGKVLGPTSDYTSEPKSEI